MPNLNPNSTNYVHSSEPNTNDLTMAMDYTSDGKPAVRVLSNIQGDITIDGDVNIPGIVTVTNTDDDPLFTHTHLYDENENQYTASNPFTIDGTVTALQGTDPWTVDGTVELGATSLSALENINATVSGTVSVDNFPATQTVDGTVTIQDGGGSITVDGTVSVVPTALPSQFTAIDNYDDKGNNQGWEFQDDWIPLFGLRVKPGSGTEFHLLDFSITLNGGTSVVAGYRWHMNPTLDAAYTWVDLKSTGIQYVKFDDIDGTPNEITSDTMVHSRTLVGKSTSLELTPEMKQFPFTDGGIEMFLEIRRLDGGATQDLFYHLTMGID
jgi:hypothetical protein